MQRLRTRLRNGVSLSPSAALNLNFLSGSLDSRITFTRSTTATFTGSNGLIQTAAINAPRFDYDPVTLAPKGLLIEEQRTNLLTYSEQFDNAAAWIPSGATVSANQTLAPDGTTTADKIAETVGTSNHAVYRSVSGSAGVTYTLSFFFKAAERGFARAGVTDGGVDYSVRMDLSTGTITLTSAGISGNVTSFGNGWYRLAVTRTVANASFNAFAGPNLDATGTSAYAGTAGSGIFIYGAQVEVGSFATSYIPTVASQVTRSADIATMTGTNFSSWYNQSEGTLVANFTPDLTIVGNRVVAISGTGTTERTVDINGQSGNWVNYNGTAQTIIGAAIVTSTPQKIAVAYASANYGYTLNGGSVATVATVAVSNPNQMALGQLAGGSYLNGHIRSITYYNTRLPNATLQALTA